MKTTEALQKIFYRPSEVFLAIREQQTWFVAAFALIGVVVVHTALIHYSVSQAYAQYVPSEAERERYEQILEEYREEIKEAQESARGGIVDVDGWAGSATSERVVFVSDPGLGITRFNVAIAFFALLIALAIEVAYFRFVGSEMDLSFKTVDWITFSVWSRIPGAVLALLGVILVLLFSGFQANIANHELFSIVRWIPQPANPDRGVNILNIDVYHIDAALVWVIALQTIGFRIWSGRSFVVSLVVVALPTIILYAFVIWMSLDVMFWLSLLRQ